MRGPLPRPSRSLPGERSAEPAEPVAEAPEPLRLAERLLVIATVLICLCLPRFLPDSDASAGSAISRVVWTALYLIALIGIVIEWRTALRLLRDSLPVVCIVVIAVCSTFWSEASVTTAKESLGLVGTSMIALFFVCRLSLRAFVDSLATALGIAAFASAVLVAFVPSLGRMAAMDGLWQGATVHKNILGIAMVLGSATIACTIDRLRGIVRGGAIAAILVSLVLLIGSGSTTSMLVLFFLTLIVAVLLWCRTIRSPAPAAFALLALVVGASVALAAGLGTDQILGAFGKDSTLTGRTELWQFVIDAIHERPALGYGFDVFFNPASATGIEAIRALDWDVNIYMAHNGFLDITLSLGLVGLASVVAALLLGFWRTAKSFWRGRDLTSAWPLLVAIYTLLGNITEAGIARVNDVNWVVFLVAFFFVTDEGRRRRARAEVAANR